MKIKAKSTKWNKAETDLLAMFVTEEGLQDEIKDIDKMLDGFLTKVVKHEEFKAETSKTFHYPTYGKLPTARLVLIGLGKQKDISLDTFRIAGAILGKYSRESKKKTVAIDLSSSYSDSINTKDVFKAVTEGIKLGSYKFGKYKSNHIDKSGYPEELFLLTTPAKIQHGANGIAQGELYAEATLFARDLINESPTITTPTYLAHVAKSMAKREELQVEILDKKELEHQGMQAFLAVARGSDEPPKFIKLVYKNGRKKVVIVGKAITFDTGGLSLKDAKNMETMKLDMSGAATVLGIFSILPKLKPKVTVIGLIAACENMPGPSAFKPGDIVKTLNGKTIEILNTDAEGRVTLADVLAYGQKETPDYMIDIATLTGACMIALGEDIAGLFSNNYDFSQLLMKCAKSEGEKLWELPLEKDYQDLIKSDIADYRNISKSRYGGAITAALFLEEFVANIPWVHLDIAGPAFQEKDTPLIPKGGAGFGVRTLLRFLETIQ